MILGRVDAAHVYWSNVGRGSLNDLGLIGRANLDGTEVNQSFISLPLGVFPIPCGVAVDAAHVYWTELATGAIGRANLDDTAANRSFITGAENPCGVAVDATHIYWANSTGAIRASGLIVSTIGHANLDGTVVDQLFIKTGAGIPQGVAVS